MNCKRTSFESSGFAKLVNPQVLTSKSSLKSSSFHHKRRASNNASTQSVFFYSTSLDGLPHKSLMRTISGKIRHKTHGPNNETRPVFPSKPNIELFRLPLEFRKAIDAWLFCVQSQFWQVSQDREPFGIRSRS